MERGIEVQITKTLRQLPKKKRTMIDTRNEEIRASWITLPIADSTNFD